MESQKPDKMLNKSLADWNAPVEPDVWEQIAVELNNAAQPVKKRRFPLFWLFFAGVLTGVGLVYFLSDDSTNAQGDKQVVFTKKSNQVKRNTTPAPPHSLTVPAVIESENIVPQQQANQIPHNVNDNTSATYRQNKEREEKMTDRVADIFNQEKPSAQPFVQLPVFVSKPPTENTVPAITEDSGHFSVAEIVSDSIANSAVDSMDKKDSTNQVELVQKEDSTLKSPVTKVSAFQKGLFAGISVTPLWCFRTMQVKQSKEATVHKGYKDVRSAERPMPAFAVNAFVEYCFSTHLGLQAGIGYTQSGYEADYNYKNNEVPVKDSATGNILGYVYVKDSVGVRHQSRQVFTSFELPFLIGYNFALAEKWRVGIKAGGSIQCMQGARLVLPNPGNLELLQPQPEKIIRQINCNYIFSAGVHYAIKPRIFLSVEPVFRWNALPAYTKEYVIADRLYSIGINLGINCKL